MTRPVRLALLICSIALLFHAAVASAFSPTYEALNYKKINERAQTDYTPAFNAQLAQQSAVNEAQGAGILAADGPGRMFGRDPTGNLCFHHMNGCAGDVRLYGWGAKGYGIVKPILFTARNGSTLSGHVWMTRAGPAKRPGVVITNGSVQAPEELYWFAAQTLAKAGYVVMTWDPQGQGYSDTYGEGADRNDGVPSQSGEPFFDGTEDALDFFFSSPASPYVPRKSCSSGTSHADKQSARVKDGRSSAYNPFSGAIDYAHVGLVGHSLGAAAVSYVGQIDPRVKAIVAYDNLSDVSANGTSNFGQTITCKSGSSARPKTVTITKPALGMSSDYGLTPMPYTADPDQATLDSKHAGSLAASKAGADTGELMFRGGTHYEFSYIPNPGFGATRRGMDMVSWYTTAWMDRELRGDPSADARLLTTRWRQDRLEQAVDPQTPPDANLFSTYFKSRLDLHLGGGPFVCEDLRTGCAGQGADDGRPADYSFLAAASTRDSAANPDSTTAPAGSPGTPPAATGPPARRAIADAAACRTGATLRSQILSIRGGQRLTIRGKARDRCSAKQARLKKVLVSVGRLTAGKRCRFVQAAGTLSRLRSCHRPLYLLARGSAHWILHLKQSLPSGTYQVASRATDAARHRERSLRSRGRERNFVTLRLR